ncbi:MAG TPA: hypothetical protein VLG44_03885 [Chlamydiales bacterium]|nr:hypothetical protein [Chlamydiales bacterium]
MKALFAFLACSILTVSVLSAAPKKDSSSAEYQVVHGKGCSCGKGKPK